MMFDVRLQGLLIRESRHGVHSRLDQVSERPVVDDDEELSRQVHAFLFP